MQEAIYEDLAISKRSNRQRATEMPVIRPMLSWYGVPLRSTIKRNYYLTDPMFRTTSADRHPIKSAIAGHGSDVWTRASLTLDIPWYCLSYSSTSEATYGLSGTELLSKPDQVAEFLSDADAKIQIDQLLLVSPPRLNGTQQWLMEPLAEVWQGRLENHFFNVSVYVLQNGRHYVGAPNCNDWQVLQELKLLVQYSSPGSLAPENLISQ